MTLLSIGTGGIRNNRRPLENEEPKDYANRCAVQWHRVSIYREKLGDVAIKHVTPGSVYYLTILLIHLSEPLIHCLFFYVSYKLVNYMVNNRYIPELLLLVVGSNLHDIKAYVVH